MRKENVFMVSGRQCDPSGVPQGEVVTHVLCAVDEAAMHQVVNEVLPGFVTTSVVSLAKLDQTSKKIKDVLARRDFSWGLFVQPGFGLSGSH